MLPTLHPGHGLDHSGFASANRHCRPVQTRFPYGSTLRLNLATIHNSLAHYAKGTRSLPKELPLFVGTRFQVLFHSPLGVLFTFPSRYLFTIGQPGVLSLGRWSSQIPPGFHVSEGTQEHRWPASAFVYGSFTLCAGPFQSPSTSFRCTVVRVLQPRPRNLGRFGLFRVRSPLLTESRLISFPPGT